MRPEQVPQLYRSAAERSVRPASAHAAAVAGGAGEAAAGAAEVSVSAHTNRVLLMARKHSANASVRPRGTRALSDSSRASGPPAAGGGGAGAAAPFSSETGVSHAVDCGERTHAFCWECGIEPHEPASCLHFKLWLEKICEIKPDQRALSSTVFLCILNLI